MRFSTTAVPAPVIRDIRVAPGDTRAVVTFSLDERGPSEDGVPPAWRRNLDPRGRGGERPTTPNHRQVIEGLRAETDYELRVIASNDRGTTVSDPVMFRTLVRTVNCDAGEALQPALDDAKAGDTIIIKGTCTGNFRAGVGSGRLTLRGDGGRLVGASGVALQVLAARGAVVIERLTIAGGSDWNLQRRCPHGDRLDHPRQQGRWRGL